MNRAALPPTCRIASPPAWGLGGGGGGNAAIGILELRGDIDGVLAHLGARPVSAGRCALRELPGIDTLIIARAGEDHAFFFPHAGPVIVRRLVEALGRCGVGMIAPPGPVDADERLCHALAHAASPLAIDLLLDQPRRWTVPGAAPMHPAHARMLDRLIYPPTVVALGPPNIGKSSLLNALAGRTVALVADEPGTTRDHIGARIDFAGLVVRFIDAPGIEEIGKTGQGRGDGAGSAGVSDDRSIQHEAQRLALEAAATADLVLSCGDRAAGFLTAPLALRPEGGPPVLHIALRADLGLPDLATPGQPPRRIDAAVSVIDQRGLTDLVRLIRDALVCPAALDDPAPWPFWRAAGAPGGTDDEAMTG